MAYEEGDDPVNKDHILLLGTTNDPLQPAAEVVSNEFEYPVKLYDCSLYLLDLTPDPLRTSVKLGRAETVTLGLKKPTNPTLCGPNTLIATL